MNIIKLYPELIGMICQNLPLEDCLSLKLTCTKLDRMISKFDDILEARYLYEFCNDFYDFNQIYKMINSLKKGREYIVCNDGTNNTSSSILKWYCKKGDVEWVTRILKEGNIDPAYHESDSLLEAAGWGNLDILELLLADGRADPSAQNNYAIRLTSNVDIVDRLLKDPRVDPCVRDNEPIMTAIKNGELDIVNRLLGDPRINASIDYRLIYIAIKNNHWDVAWRFLQVPKVINYLRDEELGRLLREVVNKRYG